MKRFLQFIRENEYDVPDNEWHHVDPTNPTHFKVVEAFHGLADAQRGKPEAAMLKINHSHHGVLDIVEHIGDLTHRMTEMTKYGNFGHEHVAEKVRRGIRRLTYPYGFEREHQENIREHAKFHKVDPVVHTKNLDSMLKSYADEHAKLPVYNRAQFHARGAAIAMGNKDWNLATSHLNRIQDMLKSKEGWDHHASKFRWARDGHPREYNIGDD